MVPVKPILYEATETEFVSNGIGRLSDAVSCTVLEERNGQYELEMEYPVTGIHYAEILEDRIILARHDDTSDTKPFRIYKISRPMKDCLCPAYLISAVKSSRSPMQLKQLRGCAAGDQAEQPGRQSLHHVDGQKSGGKLQGNSSVHLPISARRYVWFYPGCLWPG